jgi:undecaprenyl-diphosphatase
MTTWQAVALGIIQGLTEFLPVSSTAHLRIIPALAGWDDPGAAFTAVIQWGTLVAVLLYFRHDIAALTVAWLDGLWRGRPLGTPDARLAWMIAAGTVPVVVFGLWLQKYIRHEFRSLYVIAAAMIVLALVLVVAEWLVVRRQRAGQPGKELGQVTWADALAIGLAQALALVPGTSRSGVTIAAGLFAGLTRATSARFSFLLSLPAVFGAGVHELYKARQELLATQESVVNLVIATVVSGVVGYAAIAFLLRYLRTHSTGVFIVYRLLLGGALLVLLARGVLPAMPPEDEAGSASAPIKGAKGLVLGNERCRGLRPAHPSR